MPADWGSKVSMALGRYARATAGEEGKPAPDVCSREFVELVRHEEFQHQIRDEMPWLLVPEREIVPLAGEPAWEPGLEDPEAARCPRCLGRFEPISREIPRRELVRRGRQVSFIEPPVTIHVVRIGGQLQPDGTVKPDEDRREGCPVCRGRIARGSALYCPKCQASGFDGKLYRQVRIAGLPAPEQQPQPCKARKRASRKERRKARSPKS
jgi:uncharacterized protein with PIN domain